MTSNDTYACSSRLRYTFPVIFAAAALILITLFAFPSLVARPAEAEGTSGREISFWWPTQGERDSSIHSFRGAVPGLEPDQYYMFWSVDGGRYNKFETVDSSHKEATLSFGGWNWKGDGPYEISIIVQDLSAREIARMSFDIYRDRSDSMITSENYQEPLSLDPEPQPTASVQEDTDAVLTAIAPEESTKTSGGTLYRNRFSQAQRAYESFSGSSQDKKRLEAIASQPTGIWLGGWYRDIEKTVRTFMSDAAQVGEVPLFVLYNIPGRDCGQHSAGGLSGADAYRSWVRDVARGIGSGSALVVLEPDAIALISCLSDSEQESRFSMLRDAISILSANGKTKVYLDAGHANWLSPQAAASRLSRAGVSKAEGFALNTSNFVETNKNVVYGLDISNRLGGDASFVIDTSRNGRGPNGEWCNPGGRALGETPTLNTGVDRVDGFLWAKAAGESDGRCNGGPAAGVFWVDYAIDLARNAGY